MKTQLPVETSHLMLHARNLFVPATDGKRTFVSERNSFKHYFDSNIIKWGVVSPSSPSPSRNGSIYAVRRSGTFVALLASFGVISPTLFWKSQDQILQFIEHHIDSLQKERWANFFPYMEGDKRFVFRVDYKPKREQVPANFDVLLYHFEDEGERAAALDPFLIVLEPI